MLPNTTTQELMVNGLWAVKEENAEFEMILKTDFYCLGEAVYLSLREKMILLVGTLAMDASDT